MKRNIIAFTLFFILSLGANGQNVAIAQKNLLEQANDMGKKFVAKDYKGFLSYTHPLAIKSMGGEEKTLRETIKSINEIEKDGVTFLDVKFGAPPKIVTVGNEMQCIVPQSIEMHITGGKLTTTTSLIAISPDMGKKWYFTDAAGNNLQNMKGLFPTLSDELDIPMPSDPIFEEDVKTE